ncbi:MAG: hypothetical protein KF891_19805 [Rhizobacter sp.]|nr:hypothetical protein [Rhizobacter sp.]
MPRLREQIFFLELADAQQVGMDARQYFLAASTAREIIERELGALAMKDFNFPHVPTLQTTAENIYFETYGYFADLDGSGHAATAQHLADALIARARRR